MQQENNITYSVEMAIPETPGVVTLRLKCDHALPPYRPGQFITVFFPETGHQEGKAYSISSSPDEKEISITVRGAGVFSNKLISKKTGDTITGSLPYGYFYSESDTTSMLMIAGGIGIAPLRSMIREARRRTPARKIILLYSNKTCADIVFKEEFDQLAKEGEGFRVVYYVTREEPGADCKKGRIPEKDILEHTKVLPDQEFFVCGSIGFVRDYWKLLKAAGVPDERIYTEAFF